MPSSQTLDDALEELRACLDRPEEASEAWLLALDAALAGLDDALSPMQHDVRPITCFHGEYLHQAVKAAREEIRFCRPRVCSPIDAVRDGAMAWVWTWAAELLVTCWDFIVTSETSAFPQRIQWHADHHSASNWFAERLLRRDVSVVACQAPHKQRRAES